ncbi:glycosyltransferase family 2 protein [Larkinella rosea]|uniref:Glycosyltransferase n=1 Tax=Larkinella rosea TaxID=2025312 RepID=A0A3P1C015_9BACT|nr:glycosyltransferase family 2 protein [Larkinella rosea]RRB06529.1 glycosyltransferase [Larkinella rosea]
MQQALRNPDLSIILVNYKTPHLIIDCLRSVETYTSGLTYEVLVVNNDPDPSGQAVVLNAFPGTRWIEMGYNSGFSRANNRGIAESAGRLVLLLNSDTLLIDNVLKRCADVLDSRPGVAAVGPMQITREGKVHTEAFDGFSQLRRYFYIVPGSGFFKRLLHRFLPDKRYADPNEVDWLIGSFIMTRRETIEKAGGLDESFFMYAEDVEWCWRLGKQGQLLLLRDAFYVHLEYGSSSDYQESKVTHINRFKSQMHVSNLLWVRKQYGAGAYLVLILHYLTLIPVIFGWKIAVNLLNVRNPFSQLDNQRAFARQVGIFLRFFWQTLFNQKGFYKV